MPKKNKRQNRNDLPEIEVVEVKLNPLIEQAISSKKDSLITITADDMYGMPHADQFILHYDAEKDKYEFVGGQVSEARFYASIFNFENNFGVVVIRTFLDKVSHHKIKDDGTSKAVSFQEMRMFRSNGEKVEQVNAFEMFVSMVTNSETDKIEFERYQQQEIYCDEFGSFPAPELMEKLKHVMS